MKSLVLKLNQNYPELIVYQESNSFGDQLLTFKFEHQDGSIVETDMSFPEGNWEEFTKRNMKSWAKTLAGMGRFRKKAI